MTHRVIINPYANRWRAQQHVETIRSVYRATGLDHEIVLTTRAGEAKELAEAAVAQGFSAVVAAGGDGTVNEVVNGLVGVTDTDTPTLPLGIIPIGTGNDLADMLPVSRDVATAVSNIMAGNMRQIDLGSVIVDDGEPFIFDNNCALAMEPMVNAESNQFNRLGGTPRYLAGLISALFKLRAWPMQIAWEGGEFEGKCVLLSVCNGPRAGSTFMMAPDAKVDDGLFDVVLAPDLKMTTILRVLPGLFSGAHLKHPQVTHFRTSWLTVSCAQGTPIHADGEMLGMAAQTMRYELLPAKLTLLGG